VRAFTVMLRCVHVRELVSSLGACSSVVMALTSLWPPLLTHARSRHRLVVLVPKRFSTTRVHLGSTGSSRLLMLLLLT